MVRTFEAQLLVTPAGKPVTVAPVAPVVAYVMLVMAVLIQRNCALVPAADVSVSEAPEYTRLSALPLCCIENVPTKAGINDAVLMVNFVASNDDILEPCAMRQVYGVHELKPAGLPVKKMVVGLAELELMPI